MNCGRSRKSTLEPATKGCSRCHSKKINTTTIAQRELDQWNRKIWVVSESLCGHPACADKGERTDLVMLRSWNSDGLAGVQISGTWTRVDIPTFQTVRQLLNGVIVFLTNKTCRLFKSPARISWRCCDAYDSKQEREELFELEDGGMPCSWYSLLLGRFKVGFHFKRIRSLVRGELHL